jgi:hypothetical protein
LAGSPGVFENLALPWMEKVTDTLKIGRQVSLRDAPENMGVIVDHEPDRDGQPTSFPYLVEWNDHTASWHRWVELESAAQRLSGENAPEL